MAEKEPASTISFRTESLVSEAHSNRQAPSATRHGTPYYCINILDSNVDPQSPGTLTVKGQAVAARQPRVVIESAPDGVRQHFHIFRGHLQQEPGTFHSIS